jgi:DNA-binding CsgD family transcriptional regulator
MKTVAPCQRSADYLLAERDDAPLTALERELLRLSAAGLIAAEVATVLGEPHDTIHRSLALAITKLGARSKLAAVLIALRRELIEPPGG